MLNEVKQAEQLNLDRMVRSATAGSAGEVYCSFILEAIGLIDGSSWSLEQLDDLWQDAAECSDTVAEFIKRRSLAAS